MIRPGKARGETLPRHSEREPAFRSGLHHQDDDAAQCDPEQGRDEFGCLSERADPIPAHRHQKLEGQGGKNSHADDAAQRQNERRHHGVLQEPMALLSFFHQYILSRHPVAITWDTL